MGVRHINRAERLAAIEQLLMGSTAGLRAVEIADACAVDRRTIYRDLMSLANLGVPIHQKDGRFLIDRTQHSASIRLNFDEALALLLATRATRYSVPHNPHTISALRKLSTALPSTLDAFVQQSVEALNEMPPDAHYLMVLETVARAWAERTRIKLWYAGRDNRMRSCDFATYIIDQTPLGVIYAVGLDVVSQRVRTIKLHRVKSLGVSSEGYHIPPQFDPARYTAR
jgi:proteasome accessory factor B